MGIEYGDVPYVGPPAHYRSGRNYGAPHWIVIHCTANDATAEQEASYATRRKDSVSAHYFVDNDSIVQGLATWHTAFHAGRANNRGIGYEITGQVFWSREKWMSSVAWPILARQIARDCRKYHIPVRLLTVDQIRSGVTGILTHNLERLAFSDTTHTDPGAGFPLDHLLALVAAELGTTPPGPGPNPSPDWTQAIVMSLPNLSRGAKGTAVTRLQALLNAAGQRLSEDGDFGPRTEAAVRAEQSQAGIGVDGEVGKHTWSVLLTGRDLF